jgi:hypothetical protein
MRTLPLAPGDDVTVHIVLNDWTARPGLCRNRRAKADEATIIEHPERSVFAPVRWSRSTPPTVGRVM